jgi:hypothetical protein
MWSRFPLISVYTGRAVGSAGLWVSFGRQVFHAIKKQQRAGLFPALHASCFYMVQITLSTARSIALFSQQGKSIRAQAHKSYPVHKNSPNKLFSFIMQYDKYLLEFIAVWETR